MDTIAYQCDFRKQAILRAKENLFNIHPIEANTKKPHQKGYRQLATRNVRTLAKWAEKWPDANVGGIVPARLAVLDEDPRNGGDETLAELLRQNGQLARTPRVKTPGGGDHYYFYLPVGVRLKQCTKPGPGLELLSNGANILLPGSVGANGKLYEYEVSPVECNVAPLPDWLLTLALEKQRKPSISPGSDADRGDSFVLPASIKEGTRNQTLVRRAASLRSRGFAENEILTLLLKANTERCIPPLTENEVEKIAAWAGSKPAGQSAVSPDALETFANLEAAIKAAVWPGRFGFNCRRVAESLLALMLEKGKTQVDAGARFLSLRTGLSRATISRCCRALTDREKKTPHLIPRLFDCHFTRLRLDFIQFNAKTIRHEQTPHCYRVSQNIVTLRQDPLPERGGVEPLCLKMTIIHDAFRSRKGMTSSRAVVLEVIEQSEIHSAVELSERTRLTLVTAQRCLTELRKEGLIVKSKKVWHRTELDLDAVAKRRGSAGATARQRAEYERDRDNYEVDVIFRMGKARSPLKIVPAPERDATEDVKVDEPETEWSDVNVREEAREDVAA